MASWHELPASPVSYRIFLRRLSAKLEAEITRSGIHYDRSCIIHRPARPESEAAKAKRLANQAEIVPGSICICQRMYDGQPTGIAHIDRWIAKLDWPSDWFSRLYHGRGGSKLARRVKYRIEANCTAAIHYPRLLSDDLYGGRAVYTSSDPEKAAENREADEKSREVYDADKRGFQRIRTTEYRTDVDPEGDTSDVLTRQRRTAQADQPTKGGTVQMTFDPNLTSPAERKALSNQRREKREYTAFEKLYFDNKRRAAAKNAQARRDCWNLIREQDEDTQKLLVAFVKDEIAKGVEFTAIRKSLRMTTRSLVAA